MVGCSNSNGNTASSVNDADAGSSNGNGADAGSNGQLAAPTGLTATRSDGEIQLSWTPVDSAEGITYTVGRAMQSGGPYQVVSTARQDPNYLDSTTKNTTAYYYVVTADNGSASSAPSAELAVAAWPVGPLQQLKWQHCTPYEDGQSVPATISDATILHTYLNDHPAVAKAMVWLMTDQTAVAWSSWPSWLSSLLDENFVAYWAWYAGGGTGSDPTPVIDPPPNLNTPDGRAGAMRTAMSVADASRLYVKYVALTLVFELQNRTPWRLDTYDGASLAELLDSRKFFESYGPIGYNFIWYSVIPPPPLMAAQFVREQHFLCVTKAESIAEAVFWARKLEHFIGPIDGETTAEAYWHYVGTTPASRVLSGTSYSGSDPLVPTNLTRWTYGCHGTTGLLKALLRAINIPVEHFSGYNPALNEGNNPFANSFVASGHATPHFLSEGLWLSHGDDPYIGSRLQTVLPYPLTAMLVPDAQFFAWFPNTGYHEGAPVGRQTSELWIRYGTRLSLQARERDLTERPIPPDQNFCADIGVPDGVNNYYTCAEAEAVGLATHLDSLLAPYGENTQAIDADIERLPFYRFPDPEFLPPPCDTCASQACSADSTCCNAWSIHCQRVEHSICGDICAWGG